MKDHLHILRNKSLLNMLGIIKRNFKHMDSVSFLYLYKSLVRSIVEYNSSVWSPPYMGQIEELKKVQRRATKLVRDAEICHMSSV